MTPQDEFKALMLRMADLATRGVRLGIRIGETSATAGKTLGGFESVLFHEQHVMAEALAAEVEAFLVKRVEAAKHSAAILPMKQAR